MSYWPTSVPKPKMRLFALALFTASLMALSYGCGSEDQAMESKAKKVERKEEQVFLVRVTEPQVMDVESSIDAIGSFLSNDEVKVSPEIDGVVSKIYKEEGARVQPGTPLLKIDDERMRLQVKTTERALAEAEANLKHLLAGTRKERVEELRARLRQAEASLQEAEKERERFKKLLSEQVIDRRTYDLVLAKFDGAKANFEAAREALAMAVHGPTEEEIAISRARVATARANLGLVRKELKDTTVYSPIEGEICEKYVSVGTYVKKGSDLFRIIDINPLKLSFRLPEKFIGKIKINQAVTARVKAFPQEQFKGEVYFISPDVNPNERTFEVRAFIGNAQGRLKPGLFANVTLVTEVRKKALVLPEQALVVHEGQPAVFVVKDAKVQRKLLDLGERFNGKATVVSSNLRAGEKVVIAGQDNLEDGSRVRVAEMGPEQR